MNSGETLDQALRRVLRQEVGQSCHVLKEASSRLHRPVSTLYALDGYNDPFYIGSVRAGAAEWFAGVYHLLGIPVGYHYRRIHYRMVSQAEPLAFHKGGAYENTTAHWDALNFAARDAVALGLIPYNAFVDRRNPNPILFLAQPVDSAIEEIAYREVLLAPRMFPMPPFPRYGDFNPGVIPQPYHVEIWAEKSTMNDILLPLAQRYNVNLITGVGELTYTACRNFIRRLDGRPARIIYIADFDPAGLNMPVSVARKIEFELYRQGLDNDVQVRAIILTHDQCVQYRLPRTPIKASDRRGARFEQRFGEGATELDALEALYPGEFAAIVSDEIKRYWNPDHEREVQEQIDQFRQALDEVQQRVYAQHQAEIDAFKAKIDGLNQQLRKVNRRAAVLRERMKPLWQAMAKKLEDDQPKPELECPEFEDVDEDDDPLFDSQRDYVEQIDCYKDYQDKPKERRQRQPSQRHRPPITRHDGDAPPRPLIRRPT